MNDNKLGVHELGVDVIIFFVDVVITSLCMYLATSLSYVKAELKLLLTIVFIVSLIALIPTIGWVLSIFIFIYLLTRVTDSNVLDCVWVVAFTKIFTFMALFLFSTLFS